MTGTNEPIDLAAMSRHELVKLIRSLQQQVNLLQHELEVQTKAAEIGAKNLIVAEQQVNTLTEALEKIRDGYAVECGGHLSKSEMREIADKALQSIKESPREEQGK
jgi:hypothetical protein